MPQPAGGPQLSAATSLSGLNDKTVCCLHMGLHRGDLLGSAPTIMGTSPGSGQPRAGSAGRSPPLHDWSPFIPLTSPLPPPHSPWGPLQPLGSVPPLPQQWGSNWAPYPHSLSGGHLSPPCLPASGRVTTAVHPHPSRCLRHSDRTSWEWEGPSPGVQSHLDNLCRLHRGLWTVNRGHRVLRTRNIMNQHSPTRSSHDVCLEQSF